MIKSLKDIALPITEEEYRNDGRMHYSTLATYERGGFAAIATLGEKKESASLTFGSCVDALITGGREEFDSRFLVAEFPVLKPSDSSIVKVLFDRYHIMYPRLTNIPDEELFNVAEEVGYNKNWRAENRIKSIKENCAEYYNLMLIAEGKEVIDTATYNDVMAAVRALKTSPATEWYFRDADPFDDSIERVYQPKFSAEFDGVPYSCMMDLVVINHKDKVIYPCDLKTSGHFEYEFHKSFLDWNYYIQAQEYAAIIKANIEKDEYFKDFKIMDYRFIVVNRKSLNPLVWEWPYTFTDVEVVINNSKGYPIKLRNFRIIGKELSHYLETKQNAPEGITITTPNRIDKWIEKL